MDTACIKSGNIYIYIKMENEMIRSPLLAREGLFGSSGLEEPRFCEDVTFCDVSEKGKVSPCVLRETSRLKISSLANSVWGGSLFWRKYFIFPLVWERVSKFLVLVLSSLLLLTTLR
jgi:hypothetical protein